MFIFTKSLIFFVVLVSAPLAGAAKRPKPCEEDLLARIWSLHLANPPLEVGQPVILGDDQPADLPAVWPGGIAGSYGAYPKVTAKFLAFAGEDWVKVQELDSDDSVYLQRPYLQQIRDARPQLLQAKMNLLDSPALAFTVGQKVRFRNAGLMDVGVIRDIQAQTIQLDTDSGLFWVSKNEVFARITDDPVATLVRPTSSGLSLRPPTAGVGLDFLNQVARLTSQPEFTKLSRRQQIRRLAQIVVVFTPWHACALRIDAEREVGLNELLLGNAAVCRHIAPFVALLLNETGFPAKLWHVEDHIWVEVDEGPQSLIVDASIQSLRRRVTLATRAELAARRREGRVNFANRYYLNPARTAADP